MIIPMVVSVGVDTLSLLRTFWAGIFHFFVLTLLHMSFFP